jgi:hypothetical protein
VPDAESFLVKHYIEKHVEGLLHLVRAHPLYSPPSCIRTISLLKAGPPEGIPRNTISDSTVIRLRPDRTGRRRRIERKQRLCPL